MIIDIVVGAVIIISAIISFLRGFIREVLTIAGVVGGLFAAIFFGPKLSPTFKDWFGVIDGENIDKLLDLIPMSVVADICAYGVIFVSVVLVISLISHFTAGAVKAIGLGPVDRSLGVVFGIIRGVVLFGLIYLPFHLWMDENSKARYFSDSRTYPYIEQTSDFLAKFAPSVDDVQERVEETKESIMKQKLLENEILSRGMSGSSEENKSDTISPTETGYEKKERQELFELMQEPTVNE